MMGSFIDKHLVLNPFIVKAEKIKILENKNYNSKVFLRLENQLISLWMMIKYDYDVDDKMREKNGKRKIPNKRGSEYTKTRNRTQKKREKKIKMNFCDIFFTEFIDDNTDAQTLIHSEK